MHIRPARLSDLPAILAIVNDAILHTTANYHYEPETLSDRENWFHKMQEKGMPVLVAEQENTLLGYASYSQFREKIGYQFSVEHSVYVDRQFRGQGVGARLLETLIGRARQQGMHCMLGGIDAENTGSIAFHEKFGFTEVARFREVGYKFDRWLDVVFMQKML